LEDRRIFGKPLKMYLMKKILIPTDFSKNAHNAIRYALQLYAREEAVFYLVHTYTPAVYQSEYLVFTPGQIGLGEIYQENSEKKLNKLRDRLVKEFPNPLHTFVVHAAFNTLVYEVVETVAQENIEIVVMGTQGATGAQEVLLGTNAVHVVKKCPCPVLLVPPKYKYRPPQNILFPTDYEVDYRKCILRQLLDIAHISNSSIAVLHVRSGDGPTIVQLEHKSKLGAIMGVIPHRYHEVPDQDIITAINIFQLENGTDLLAMIQNKHTFLERLFIEPVIKKIGFHPIVPFLVLPPRSTMEQAPKA
jgi:nucleotide-binding universal stress UspA family protein